MKKHQNQQVPELKIASKEVWETMNQSILHIQMSDETDDTNDAVSLLSGVDAPEKRSRFDQIIHSHTGAVHLNESAPLLQQWSQTAYSHSWLKNLNAAWQSALQSMKLSTQEFQQVSIPIHLMMQELTLGLTPAPAIRDAQLLQEKVYAPKRRGIESSALPVFNPLFCTAVTSSENVITLQGLQTQAQYRLTMRGINQSDWLHETTLLSDENGSCELDIQSVLQKYQECNPDHTHIAWYLRKLNSQHQSDWTSGVIWLEDSPTQDIETAGAHQDSNWRGGMHQEYAELIEINLLLARGFYVKAYEQARTALIFARKHQLAPDSLYMASLWQFCRQAVSEMIQTLKDAEPVFMQIDPVWNAVQPLEDLLSLMTPRT